jgi:hypothetical protein
MYWPTEAALDDDDDDCGAIGGMSDGAGQTSKQKRKWQL